jgi:ABC-type sugar transport system substrate-binding protein
VNQNKPKAAVRILAMAGAIALAATAVTATSASAADPVTLGFSPISLQIPAMNGIWGGFQGYSKGAYNANTVIADPNFDGATQNQQITAWVTNKQVNGFWAITTSPAALTSSLKLAIEKGVVGVVNGVPADYGFTGMQKGISFAVIPYKSSGTRIGTAMAQCMVKRTQGTGQVIYVQGKSGTPGDPVAFAAFKSAMHKIAPKVKVVATVAGEGDLATAQNVTSSALQAHPKAVGVVGFSDEATMGGAAALKAKGVKANKTCVVGSGGGDQAVAAVKSGSLYAIVKFDFEGDLKQSVDTLIKMAKSPSTLGFQLKTPIIYVSKNSK